MLRLTLLRHAQAVALGCACTVRDAQRPLNDAGRTAIGEVARRLAGDERTCPRVIASPALRTVETARTVLAAFGLPANSLATVEALYEGTVATLLEVVQSQPPGIGHLLLCAHNPGISGLASYLAEETLPRSTLPPGSLVTMGFATDTWSSVERATGHVIRVW
ncbi:MAG TPA: histidine phosphatase family protein [Nevskiaceae bacterium]|nr:histidine phosphatase family protein [Nevskiaceae bacterium]